MKKTMMVVILLLSFTGYSLAQTEGAIVAAISSMEKSTKKDNCQDPTTLTPQLRKAYDELTKASKELGGFTVSIKCYPKGK